VSIVYLPLLSIIFLRNHFTIYNPLDQNERSCSKEKTIKAGIRYIEEQQNYNHKLSITLIFNLILISNIINNIALPPLQFRRPIALMQKFMVVCAAFATKSFNKNYHFNSFLRRSEETKLSSKLVLTGRTFVSVNLCKFKHQ